MADARRRASDSLFPHLGVPGPMTHLDEKLAQIHSEGFREGRLTRGRVGAALLGGLFRLLRRRR